MKEKINLDFDFLFKLLCENEKLLKELREEKAAHTETKARVIFATHILNGNREEATNEFTNEYDKQIKNLISENGKLNREIEYYKKSLSAWHLKFNKMV